MRTSFSPPRCAFVVGLLIALVIASTASGQSVIWTKNPAEGLNANAGKIVADCKITCAVTSTCTASIFALSSTTKRLHQSVVPPADLANPVPVPGDPSQVTISFTAVAVFDQTAGTKLPNDTYDVWVIAAINNLAYATTIHNATVQNGAGASHNPRGSISLTANGGKQKVTGSGGVTITTPFNQNNPTGDFVTSVIFYAIPDTGGPVRAAQTVPAVNQMTGIGTWQLLTINCPPATYKVIAIGYFSQQGMGNPPPHQRIGSGWTTATSTN